MKTSDSNPQNFSVAGLTSIQIGAYILLAAYLIKGSLDGYIIDGYSSNELTEGQIVIFIQVLVASAFIFSTLTLYLKGVKNAKKNNLSLWNSKTRYSIIIYGSSFLVIFGILYFLYQNHLEEYLATAFLFGFALQSLVQKRSPKEALLIPGLCLLLGSVCIIIPSYWYASLLMLGVAFVTKGIAKK